MNPNSQGSPRRPMLGALSRYPSTRTTLPSVVPVPRQSSIGSMPGHTLGGSSSDHLEARSVQQSENNSCIDRQKVKDAEKAKKKLEEKIARYSYLNISIGNKLGEGGTLEQARQMQDEKNSAIVEMIRLRDMEDKNRKEMEVSQKPGNEIVKDHNTVMREMRLRQQEKYSATIQKKPPS